MANSLVTYGFNKDREGIEHLKWISDLCSLHSLQVKTRCFCEAYTGLPVVRATENQKPLNCVVLKYSIPVSEEQQIKEK